MFTCFASSSISFYFFLLLFHFSYFLPSTTTIYTPNFRNSWKHLENTGNYGKYWGDTGADRVPNPMMTSQAKGPAPRCHTYETYFILKLTHRKNEARLECIIYSDLTITLINIHNIKTPPVSVVIKKYYVKYGKSVGNFDTIKNTEKSTYSTLHW